MKYTIKRLLAYVGKYKYPAILTIVCMIGEVIFEVLISTHAPFFFTLACTSG